MIILKFVRVRLLVFILVVLIVWLSFYYSLKSSAKDLTNTSKLELLKQDPSLLDIAVYYECLCPDSRSFFISQLLPSVEKLYNFLKIEFIPYGKAKTEIIGPSKYKFTCQHGFQECLGNKIHSCVVSRISDELKRTQVLTCMITGIVDPEVMGKKCAEKFNLDWDDIWDCADGHEGDELLKINGEKTHKLKPDITFIPTVLLNHDWGSQASILKDFWKEVCLKFEQTGYLPKDCLPN